VTKVGLEVKHGFFGSKGAPATRKSGKAIERRCLISTFGKPKAWASTNVQYWSSDGEKVIHIPGAAKCEQGGDGASSKEWI
jgi:hypothetical protein